MPWCTSRGVRIRRMHRAITIAITRSTSPGRRSPATPPNWPRTWTRSSWVCRIARRTSLRCPICRSGSASMIGRARGSTMATDAGPGTRTAAASEPAPSYSPNEIMAVLSARELHDGEIVFVGIGLPNLACNLARATHAPNMTLIYESGAVGAVPDRVAPSIRAPAPVTGSLMVTSMADVFQCFLQNGKIQVGFLGGAQVDKRGNINTTAVGPYG